MPLRCPRWASTTTSGFVPGPGSRPGTPAVISMSPDLADGAVREPHGDGPSGLSVVYRRPFLSPPGTPKSGRGHRGAGRAPGKIFRDADPNRTPGALRQCSSMPYRPSPSRRAPRPFYALRSPGRAPLRRSPLFPFPTDLPILNRSRTGSRDAAQHWSPFGGRLVARSPALERGFLIDSCGLTRPSSSLVYGSVLAAATC